MRKTKARLTSDLGQAIIARNKAEEDAREAQGQVRLMQAKLDALASVQRAIDAVVKTKTGRLVEQKQMPLGGGIQVSTVTAMDAEDALSHLFEKAQDVCTALDALHVAECEDDRAIMLNALGMNECEWELVRHKYERAHQ